MNKIVQKKQSLTIDWFLTIIPICIFIISIRADVIGDIMESWISRSGSILVIFGAYLEYRQHFKTPSNTLSVGGKLLGGFAPEMSKERKRFHKTAITFVIIGTLIWGYGDLPMKFLKGY